MGTGIEQSLHCVEKKRPMSQGLKNSKEGELSISLELTISRNVARQKTTKNKTEKIYLPICNYTKFIFCSKFLPSKPLLKSGEDIWEGVCIVH